MMFYIYVYYYYLLNMVILNCRSYLIIQAYLPGSANNTRMRKSRSDT